MNPKKGSQKPKTDATSEGALQMMKEVLKSPVQVIFCLVGVSCLLLFIPFTYFCGVYAIQARKEAPEGYDYPVFNDFWIACVAIVIFGLLDFVFYIVFTPFFRLLCKVQDDIDVREQKSIKSANSLFRLCYFAGITAFGYNAVKDEPYFPVALGGRGDYNLCSDGFPYPRHNYKVQLKIHISLGFHTAMLLKQLFISEKRQDFIEMCLHDILTLYLYGGSYLVNIWETSITVALIHDSSDILLQAAKILGETVHEIMAGVVFVSNIIIWFYTRIYVFPWVIYVSLKSPILDFKNALIIPYFRFCLIFLWLMHIYWLQLMIKIVLRPLYGGQMQDIRLEKQSKGEELQGKPDKKVDLKKD